MTARKRNKYDPHSTAPYKLSRLKLELFLQCPRCFYIDRRLGVDRVPGFPFTINNAIDLLLKKEFDTYRAQGVPHPIMREHGVDAIPLVHPDLERWRTNSTGIQHHHEPTNFLVHGAVDDLWMRPDGALIVVDYKATSSERPIVPNTRFRRQLEIYQWLLRQNGFAVAEVSYFVYANARRDRPGFDSQLDFAMTLHSHRGQDAWVDDALRKAYGCLRGEAVPAAASDCEWCGYVSNVQSVVDDWMHDDFAERFRAQ